MVNSPENFDSEPEEKSKSQIKREMEARQKLGERLTQLNDDQLKLVPMGDNLETAIREYLRLKKNEAKRRQLQYIGRVMRDSDTDAITHALNQFDASQIEHTQHFHQVERWRDRLINDKGALTEYLAEQPTADVQHLRQLIRNAKKEQDNQKNLGGSKKLFRYLRELSESAGSQD